MCATTKDKGNILMVMRQIFKYSIPGVVDSRVEYNGKVTKSMMEKATLPLICFFHSLAPSFFEKLTLGKKELSSWWKYLVPLLFLGSLFAMARLPLLKKTRPLLWYHKANVE